MYTFYPSTARSTPSSVEVKCSSCDAVNRVPLARLRGDPGCGRCERKLLPRRPVEVGDETWASEVEASPLPVLVDFWAPWCGPCRLVAPVIERIAEERASRLKVVKFDTELNPHTAMRLGIDAVPTLMLLVGGRPVDQVVGALPKQAIDRWLDRRL